MATRDLIDQALDDAARFLNQAAGFEHGAMDADYRRHAITVGYVGNCGPGFDERTWMFFHPTPKPDGTCDSWGCAENREQLLAAFRKHGEYTLRWAKGERRC